MCRAMISKATRVALVSVMMMVTLCLSATQQAAPVADNRVKMDDLIRDTQKSSPAQDEILTVWWLPAEYWEVVLESNPSIPPEAVKKFVASINSYAIFAVVDGKIGTFGGVTYKPEAEIRSSVSIVDGGGQTFLPMTASDIDADAKNLLAMLKPVLANMLGPMGENMNFFLFAGKDDQGGRLFDPRKEGRFTVKVGERELNWRLPLGSLLPSKICPKCGETLSGAYKFCPWCGSPLADRKGLRPAYLPRG